MLYIKFLAGSKSNFAHMLIKPLKPNKWQRFLWALGFWSRELSSHIYEFLGETSNFVWRQLFHPPKKPAMSCFLFNLASLEGQLN